jgi:hypothetical protein
VIVSEVNKLTRRDERIIRKWPDKIKYLGYLRGQEIKYAPACEDYHEVVPGYNRGPALVRARTDSKGKIDSLTKKILAMENDLACAHIRANNRL